MANTKSARKRVRTAERNRDRNRAARSALRSRMKALRTAIDSKDSGAPALLREVHALLDKSAARGVLARGAARRYKSRLALALGRASKG